MFGVCAIYIMLTFIVVSVAEVIALKLLLSRKSHCCSFQVMLKTWLILMLDCQDDLVTQTTFNPD